MARARAAVTTLMLLFASAALAAAQPLAAPACCFVGRCGACEEGALEMSFCGASEARCSRCNGDWCGSDAAVDEGNPVAAAVAPAPSLMAGLALDADAAGAFCCFYSPASALEDKCMTCTSMADAGHWCSASRERCEGICAGTLCAPGTTNIPMPAVTTSASTTMVVIATTTPAPARVTETPTTEGGGNSSGFCCFYSAVLSDKCGGCSSRAPLGNWCNESRDRCEGVCSGFFCPSGGDSGTPTATVVTNAPPLAPPASPAPPAPPAPPAQVTTPNPTATLPAGEGRPLEWIDGTWTTGYWDCMKPSCAWPGKGFMTSPVRACSASSRGRETVNVLEPSAREGGQAVSCVDNQPFSVSPTLSFGFAAAAVSGQHGLEGDENCGQCFALKFTDQIHLPDKWGGAHPGLVGHTIIIQVTNIGFDVSGVHSFDLQIPSAGQGAFTNGCSKQFPEFSSGDFDCDNNYGGCSSKAGCARQPLEFQSGCSWRYDIYKWLEEGGRTNNPYVRFARVQCPQKLIAISGSAPLDDADYPVYTATL